jgi:microcystin-dependent protein
MLIKNLSTRRLTLRDADGNQYIIDPLSELVVSDTLIEDNTFRRWLRWRLRDIYISPFVNVQKNSVAIGSKPAINFIEGTNVTLTVAQSTSTMDVTIAAGANVDWNNLVNRPSIFPVTIRNNGSDIGNRPHVNFHAGSNISLTITDDTPNNEVDVTIAATGTLSVDWTDISNKPTTFAPTAHQSSHQTGQSDALSGNLDAVARLNVSKGAIAVAARRRINFIEGTGITITAIDNSLNERVDVTIDATTSTAPQNASFITMSAEAGLTAESVLGTQVIMKGLSANQPVTGVPGRTYYITDVGFRRDTRDSGAGWDDKIIDWNYVGSKPTTFPAAAHASTHTSGQSDAIKLDDLAAPDDNTDLNVTINAHGLAPKLSGNSGEFLNGLGQFAQPPTAAGVPTGVILPYGGQSAPAGFVLADGSAISRTTYAALFSVFGVLHGPGDGVTTFNVPDLQGRVPVGKSGAGGHADVTTLGAHDGVALANRRPKHQHTVYDPGHTHKWQQNVLAAGSSKDGHAGTNSTSLSSAQTGVKVNPENAASSNSPQDAPAYIVVNYIIKT